MGNSSGKERDAGKVTPIDVVDAKMVVEKAKKAREADNSSLTTSAAGPSTSASREEAQEAPEGGAASHGHGDPGSKEDSGEADVGSDTQPHHGDLSNGVRHQASSPSGASNAGSCPQDDTSPVVSASSILPTQTVGGGAPGLIPRQRDRTTTETLSSVIPSIEGMRQKAMMQRIPTMPSETPASTAFVRQFRHATGTGTSQQLGKGPASGLSSLTPLSGDNAQSAEVIARVDEVSTELSNKRVHPSTSRERSVLEKTVLILKRRINEENERRVKLSTHINLVYEKANENETKDATACEQMEADMENRYRTKVKRARKTFENEMARLQRERAELEDLTQSITGAAEKDEKDASERLEKEIAEIDDNLKRKLDELMETSEKESRERLAAAEERLERSVKARGVEQDRWSRESEELRRAQELCEAEVRAKELEQSSALKTESLCASRLQAMRDTILETLEISRGEEEDLRRELDQISIEREATTRRVDLEKASADTQLTEQDSLIQSTIERAIAENEAELAQSRSTLDALEEKLGRVAATRAADEATYEEEVVSFSEAASSRKQSLAALEETSASEGSARLRAHEEAMRALTSKEKTIVDGMADAKRALENALAEKRRAFADGASSRETDLMSKKAEIGDTARKRDEEVSSVEAKLAQLKADHSLQSSERKEKERLQNGIRSLPKELAQRREKAYRTAASAYESGLKKAMDAFAKRKAAHERRETELTRAMESTSKAVEDATRMLGESDLNATKRVVDKVARVSKQLAEMESRASATHVRFSEKEKALADRLAVERGRVDEIRQQALQQVKEDGSSLSSTSEQLTTGEKIKLAARLMQVRVRLLEVRMIGDKAGGHAGTDADELMPPATAASAGCGHAGGTGDGVTAIDDEDDDEEGREEDVDMNTLTRRRCEELMAASCTAKMQRLDSTFQRLKAATLRDQERAMMAIKEDMDALRERKMRLEKEKSEVSSERQADAAAKAKALSASVQEMKARLDSERQEYQRTHEKHMTEYQIVEKRHAAELDRLDDARSRAERDADTTMLASVNKHLKLDDSEAGSRHSLNVGEIDSSAAQELERLAKESREHESMAISLRERIEECERLVATKKQQRASLAVEEASMLETLQSAYAKMEVDEEAALNLQLNAVERASHEQLETLQGELDVLRHEMEDTEAAHANVERARAQVLQDARQELDTFMSSGEKKLAGMKLSCQRLAMECEEIASKYSCLHESATSSHEKRKAEIDRKRREREAYLSEQREELSTLIKEADAETMETLRRQEEMEADCRTRLTDVVTRIDASTNELRALEEEHRRAKGERMLADEKLALLRGQLKGAIAAKEKGAQLVLIESQKVDSDVADSEEQLRIVRDMVSMDRESGGGGTAIKADLVATACSNRIASEDAARAIIDAARSRFSEATTEYEEGCVSLGMREDAARRELLSCEEAAEMELEKSTFEIAEHRRRASEALASQLISVEHASKLASDKFENDMRQLGAQLERDHKALVSKEVLECAQLEQRRDESMRSALKWLAQHRRSIEDGSAAAKYQRDAATRRIVQELKDLESNLGKASLVRDKLMEEIDYLQRSKLSAERTRSSDIVVIAEYESKELTSLAEDEALLVAEPTLVKLLKEIEPAMAYTATTTIGRRAELISTILDARGYDKMKEYGLEGYCSTILATLRAVVRMEASTRERNTSNGSHATSAVHDTDPSVQTGPTGTAAASTSPTELEALKQAVVANGPEARQDDSTSDELWKSERMASVLSLHTAQMDSLEKDKELVSRRCSLRITAAQAACDKAIERLEASKVLRRARLAAPSEAHPSSAEAAATPDSASEHHRTSSLSMSVVGEPEAFKTRRRDVSSASDELILALDAAAEEARMRLQEAEDRHKKLSSKSRHEEDSMSTVLLDIQSAESRLKVASTEEHKARRLLQHEKDKLVPAKLPKSVSGGRGRLGIASQGRSSATSTNAHDQKASGVGSAAQSSSSSFGEESRADALSEKELEAMAHEVERLSAVTKSLQSKLDLVNKHHKGATAQHESTLRSLAAAEKELKKAVIDTEQELKQVEAQKTACREKLQLDLREIEEDKERMMQESLSREEERLAREIAELDADIAKERANLQAAVEEIKAETSNEVLRLQGCEKELKAKFALENENIKRESDRRKKNRNMEQRRAVKALEVSRANVVIERRDEEDRARRQLVSLAAQIEHEWKLLLEKEATSMRKLFSSISERRQALANRIEADRKTLEESFAMARWDADQAERGARNKLEVIEERERQSKSAIVTLQMELAELRTRDANADVELSAKLNDAIQEYKRMVHASKRQIESEAKDILNSQQLDALRKGFVVAESSLDAIAMGIATIGDSPLMHKSKKFQSKELDEEALKFEAEKAAALLEIAAMERELKSLS